MTVVYAENCDCNIPIFSYFLVFKGFRRNKF